MEYYPVLPREVKNARTAVAACVCGILGCLLLTPLLGIVLGVLGLVQIKKSGGVLRGRGFALAGIYGGVVWTLLWIVGLLAASWYLPREKESQIRDNEARAVEALLQISAAEEFIDMGDQDHNQAHDYWTADVAGLFRYLPKNIDVSLARADALPLPEDRIANGTPEPCSGFLFAALKKDEEGAPYQRDEDGDGKSTTNSAGYAFCAFPARHGETGRRSFIVSKAGTIYAKDRGPGASGAPVTEWPKDPGADKWLIEPRPKPK